MLEDSILDLLAAHGGYWEGTSENLIQILAPIYGEMTPEKLSAELRRCQKVLIEKKKTEKSRLICIFNLPANLPADKNLPADLPANLPGDKNLPANLPANLPGEQNPGRFPVANLPADLPADKILAGCKKSNTTSKLVQRYYEQKTISPGQEQIQELTKEAQEFLEIIREPGEIVEIRGLRQGRKGSVSGWFSDMRLAAQKAVGICKNLKGTYFTLNPVDGAVTDKIQPVEHNSKDEDVLSRRWLLIDIEGDRTEKGSNSTDEEVCEAIELAEHILKQVSQARPVVLCSGNGCHLLYRIEAPNDQATSELVRRALHGLAHLYDRKGRASIDKTVFNASRISKLPGTYTAKGAHSEERPCRWARVLDWGVEGELPLFQLEVWAQHYKQPNQAPPQEPTQNQDWQSPVDPGERAKKYLEQRKPAVEGQGGDEWTFHTCAKLVIEFDLSDSQALEALRDWNSRCQPPWSPEELSEKLENARKYGKGTPGAMLHEKPKSAPKQVDKSLADQLNQLPCTDLGNAEALIKLYGPRLRWYSSGGHWLWWSGKLWEKDTGGKALSWANKTARARREAAQGMEDEEQRKRLLAYSFQSENASRRDATLSQFKAYTNHVVQNHQLDRDPWLLNCQNGTINLRTGILQAHNQLDYITRQVECEYQEGAECPRWLAYLDRVMGGSKELIDYLKRAVGYTLTGNTSEHAVFILHGNGRNGKSLFLKILARLLGDYAKTAQSKTFQDTGQVEAISNALARLDGCRLCMVSETSANYKLDEAQVKCLSGQDVVTARYLHQEYFEFTPAFKIWIASNYKPLVSGADLGIWRRLKLIPWTVTISESEEDTGLYGKLLEELPGILSWAVQGCLEWQAAGRLREPAVVSKAIEDYRHESDTLSQFIADRCVTVFPERSIDLGELYAAYLDWAKLEGHRVTMHKQTLSKKLKEKGFEHFVSGRLKRPYFRGILLRTDDPHAAYDDHLAREACEEIEKQIRDGGGSMLDLF